LPTIYGSIVFSFSRDSSTQLQIRITLGQLLVILVNTKNYVKKIHFTFPTLNYLYIRHLKLRRNAEISRWNCNRYHLFTDIVGAPTVQRYVITCWAK